MTQWKRLCTRLPNNLPNFTFFSFFVFWHLCAHLFDFHISMCKIVNYSITLMCCSFNCMVVLIGEFVLSVLP